MPWLLAVVGLLLYEAWALRTGRPTLSLMMRRCSQAWTFFDVFVGLVVGVLLAHFFWVWCP